jgi:hypothetical protein
MKATARALLRSGNMRGLAEYIRENFGMTIGEACLQDVIAQASEVGGPPHDPWSESTWRMWLKNKVSQPSLDIERPTSFEVATPRGINELEAALSEAADTVLATEEFGFCDACDVNDLLVENEEAWQQLFPAGEEIGNALEELFVQRGGRELLGNAPFASWLYARLLFLGIRGVHEENDLGGYYLDLVVRSTTGPVGVVFLEADTDRVEAWVEARTSTLAGKIKTQLLALLLQDIKEVSRSRLEVYGAEIEATNDYGWNGIYFLGEANVRG